MFAKVRKLEEHNRWLEEKLKQVTEERDEWEQKAVEISHMLTYTSEKLNHHGLSLIRKDNNVPT